jgi:DNA-binding beta-propeller fold protein YncE
VGALSSRGARPSALAAAVLLFALLAALLPFCALGAKAPKPKSSHPSAEASGRLVQLAGERGCLVDRSAKRGSCGIARALKGSGPFMGSRAIAVSEDGKNVYAASSRSDAIAIFTRNQKTGALTQPAGRGGCVSAKGRSGCAKAVGLDGPNSVALSPEGRFLYATSRASNSVTAFHRNTSTGALTQLAPGAGCVSGVPIPGCAGGRALVGPDVVAVSPDGKNVYVGSFFGNAVAIFQRAKNGVLYQATDTSGCIAEATAGCAPGIALGAPEGLVISPEGSSVYVASALSNAVVELVREPSTGALSQPTDGSGCIAGVTLTGCISGVQLSGANAVAIAPAGRDVYVTSLFSNSVTSFSRSAAGVLSQKPGTHACTVYLRAVGCSFGRAMIAPEGLAVSPDGSSIYLASFKSGAIDVLDRERESGVLAQKAGRAGCLASRSLPGCGPGRALHGVSSIAVSPDGRFVYSTSFASNAVDVFRRNR